MSSIKSIIRATVIGIGVPVIWANASLGGICPPGYPSNLPCPTSAYETVEIEHEDRKARLSRLSHGSVKPGFYTEYLTPSEHGLPDFPVNIPVLRVVFDQKVFFDFDSSAIRFEAHSILDVIADSLKSEPPDVALFIAGHTDAIGSEVYNFNLGLKRADAVAQALVRRAVYQASVYRVSFGEAVSFASNDTDEGRARNRRVEFLFGAKPAAVVGWLQKQKVETCAARDQSELAACHKEERFDARKVSVSPVARKQVVDLDKKVKKIEKDTSLTPAEVERQMQEIEVARRKIPVIISRDRTSVILRRN